MHLIKCLLMTKSFGEDHVIFNVDPRERSFSIILGTGKFLWRQLESFFKWMLSQKESSLSNPNFQMLGLLV